MSWLSAARARLRLLSRRGAEARMVQEIEFHLRMESERLVREEGLSPHEAQRRARVAFGGVERHKEELRAGRGLAWLGGLSLDLKLGLRMLAKHPGLAIVGGLGMALAIAIGAGTWSVFNTYFYPELPLHEGERVVLLANWEPRQRNEEGWTIGEFVTLRDELRTVTDVGAFRTVRRNFIPATGPGEPVSLAEMSAAGFRVARVAPLLGRTLQPDDERRHAPPAVVIGHDVWTSRFGSDPAVIGKVVRLGRTDHTVVGVMPRDFGFPVSHSWWVPLRADVEAAALRRATEVDVFARLAPGATREEAAAELRVVRQRLAAAKPATRAERERLALRDARVLPWSDIFADGEGSGNAEVVIIQLILSLLLVLVCLNVAVLVYARTVTRTTEIAVRTALGASRARIVGQLFAESLVLSLLAALLGLGLVSVALGIFDAVIPRISDTGRVPFWIDTGLSAGTIAYALLLAVLGATITGVLPALRATGAQLRATIANAGGMKPQLGRTWTFFIVLQVAIAVVALPVAIVGIHRHVEQLMRGTGLAAHEYLSARFQFDTGNPVAADSARALREQADSVRARQVALLARLGAEPGVVGATLAARAPGLESIGYVETEGAPSRQLRIGHVDASWFELVGVRVIAGRTLGTADAAMPSVVRPVVVNRSFVTELLGGGVGVGSRLRYRVDADSAQPWLEIVGVIEDFPNGFRDPLEGAARVYHLAAPGELQGGMLLVRLRNRSPSAFAPALQRVAASVDPTLQLGRIEPLQSVYDDRSRAIIIVTTALVLVTASVLLLSAAGIHALMSFTINQRRKEIGIRAALGADARHILSGVLARATMQLAAGVAAGLLVALVLERWTEGELMAGRPLVVAPVVALFMTVVGLLAALGPARRGLRVQPTEALRAE